MGLLSMLREVFNTRRDAVSKGASDSGEDTSFDDFVDLEYERINRNIENARWAYWNDSTVNSSINNAVITANHDLKIVADDPIKYKEALHYMRELAQEWDLENFLDEVLTKALVEGACYIQKSIVNGKLKLSILAYDGDKFDIKEIRDPLTEEILGYKQKATITTINGGWEGVDFDDVDVEEEEVTFDFAPEEIIAIKYMEQDGVGRSVIYPALDLIDMKKRIEIYMLKSAHKSGTIIGIEVGADEYDISAISDADIEEIVGWFKESDKKEAVAYPAGIKPHHMGQNVLLDYTLYLKYLKSEIRSVMMTPDSKFESSKGSRFTAKEQMSGSAGFLVYMEYLRSFIQTFLQSEIIDEGLSVGGFEDAIGHIFGQYPDLDQDSSTENAEIAQKLKNIDPEADSALIRKAYFKEYYDLEVELMERGDYVPPSNSKPTEEPESPEDELTNTEDELDPVVKMLRERGWNGLKGSV